MPATLMEAVRSVSVRNSEPETVRAKSCPTPLGGARRDWQSSCLEYMESRLRAPSHCAATCGSRYALPQSARATPPAPRDFCASPTTLAAAVQRHQRHCNCCTFCKKKLQRLIQLLQPPSGMPWAALAASAAAASIAAIAAACPPTALTRADTIFHSISPRPTAAAAAVEATATAAAAAAAAATATQAAAAAWGCATCQQQQSMT